MGASQGLLACRVAWAKPWLRAVARRSATRASCALCRVMGAMESVAAEAATAGLPMVLPPVAVLPLGTGAGSCQGSLRKPCLAQCIQTPLCTAKRILLLKRRCAGNDLARVLNWGNGLAAMDGGFSRVLTDVVEAQSEPLDRWTLLITSADEAAASA